MSYAEIALALVVILVAVLLPGGWRGGCREKDLRKPPGPRPLAPWQQWVRPQPDADTGDTNA